VEHFCLVITEPLCFGDTMSDDVCVATEAVAVRSNPCGAQRKRNRTDRCRVRGRRSSGLTCRTLRLDTRP